MFFEKELKQVINVSEAKIDEILHSDKGSDLDYIRNLQTLVTLKDAAEKRMDKAIKGE